MSKKIVANQRSVTIDFKEKKTGFASSIKNK